MKHPVRLIVGVLVALGMAVVPALPASAHNATAVVAVFTGDAAVSPGLCIPGDAPGCVGPTSATYNLTIPGPAGTVPKLCFAAGVFEGTAIVPSLPSNNCGLVANGTVTASLTPPLPAGLLKPSCGLSHGESTGTNNVTLSGVGTRSTTTGWITSAGGTIPVTGTVDDGAGGTHLLVAVVQARPITPAGTIACVTFPATDFIVGGVAAVV